MSKSILYLDGTEHGYHLGTVLSESFILAFGKEIETVIAANIHEANDVLSNQNIDLMILEPKYIGDYNNQDISMYGQTVAGIDFVQSMKRDFPSTKICVRSDYSAGEMLDMLGDCEVDAVYSKGIAQFILLETLSDLLSLDFVK